MLSVLDKYKNKCPTCNHNEVQLEDDGELFCSYCLRKWSDIDDYEFDCEIMAKEWNLQDRVNELQAELDKAKSEIKNWENWADKSGILWREADVKRFEEIDKQPLSESEKKDLRECLETYLKVKPKIKGE